MNEKQHSVFTVALLLERAINARRSSEVERDVIREKERHLEADKLRVSRMLEEHEREVEHYRAQFREMVGE